jgi:hypothetical protein
MGLLLRWAAGKKVGKQGFADIGPAVAAILHEEQHDLAEALEIRVIDDGSAMAVTSHKASPCEDRQMRRHGVLGNLEKPGYFACGDPVWFATHQKAKRLEPSGLSERGEACNG